MATYRNSDSCPKCGGHDTEWEHGLRENASEVYVDVKCADCGEEWTDVFSYDHSECDCEPSFGGRG